ESRYFLSPPCPRISADSLAFSGVTSSFAACPRHHNRSSSGAAFLSGSQPSFSAPPSWHCSAAASISSADHARASTSPPFHPSQRQFFIIGSPAGGSLSTFAEEK